MGTKEVNLLDTTNGAFRITGHNGKTTVEIGKWDGTNFIVLNPEIKSQVSSKITDEASLTNLNKDLNSKLKLGVERFNNNEFKGGRRSKSRRRLPKRNKDGTFMPSMRSKRRCRTRKTQVTEPSVMPMGMV